MSAMMGTMNSTSKKSRKRAERLAGQPIVPSAVAVAATFHSGAGVHQDQRRRTDARAERRDWRRERQRGDWS
jgi:hypothetical protein